MTNLSELGKLYAFIDKRTKTLYAAIDLRFITEEEYNEEIEWLSLYENIQVRRFENRAAYTDGYMSYKDGLSINDNRYEEGSEKYIDFQKGYIDARLLGV